MAQYGNLTLREKETESGVIQVYMGQIIVPDLLSGQIAIAERDAPDGAKMTHVVKVNQGSGWATVGLAMFKRKNPKSAWYISIKIDTPIIKAKLGDALWLSAFGEGEGVNLGERGHYDAEDYQIVWSGGNAKRTGGAAALADDEIPFN